MFTSSCTDKDCRLQLNGIIYVAVSKVFDVVLTKLAIIIIFKILIYPIF